MTERDRKLGMVSDEEGRRIRTVAGRLAWNTVWQYNDGEGATVFVLEAGPGRTLSRWHVDRLVESIGKILGPDRAFFIEGIEAVDPNIWTQMTLL